MTKLPQRLKPHCMESIYGMAESHALNEGTLNQNPPKNLLKSRATGPPWKENKQRQRRNTGISPLRETIVLSRSGRDDGFLREGLIESKNLSFGRRVLVGPNKSRFLAVLGMEERKAKDLIRVSSGLFNRF